MAFWTCQRRSAHREFSSRCLGVSMHHPGTAGIHEFRHNPCDIETLVARSRQPPQMSTRFDDGLQLRRYALVASDAKYVAPAHPWLDSVLTTTSVKRWSTASAALRCGSRAGLRDIAYLAHPARVSPTHSAHPRMPGQPAPFWSTTTRVPRTELGRSCATPRTSTTWLMDPISGVRSHRCFHPQIHWRASAVVGLLHVRRPPLSNHANRIRNARRAPSHNPAEI
jgi:hypothetical protein